MSKNLTKILAGGVAAVVLTAGAWALGNSASGTSSSNASAAVAAQPGAAPPSSSSGSAPSGARPGMPGGLSLVTGATAKKVAAAALARYPGSIERVFKLADGSYVAHVIASSGEVHVAVSKQFKVTGVAQGGPPGGAGGAPPSSSGGTPPAAPSSPAPAGSAS